MFVIMLISKELNTTDSPRLIKNSFLAEDFKDKNSKLKQDVIRKLLK
jgi:hypothetical protein